MSHVYTTSTAVGTLLGTSFSSATDPTDTEVASVIARVGKYVDSYTGHAWTVATATEYFDTFSEHRLSYSGILEADNTQAVFHLANRPIITIGTCQVNVGGTSSESWTTQASGYGGDFLIYREEGYIEFITWIPRKPWPGKRNLRVLYTYGETTVPNDIKYAIELLVAEEVLLIQNSGRPLTSVSVGGTSYNWGSLVDQRKAYHDKALGILDARGATIQAFWR